ncbi:MAG: DsbC family protein [bacterium]|nr:DsbC family protein [bacterium]
MRKHIFSAALFFQVLSIAHAAPQDAIKEAISPLIEGVTIEKISPTSRAGLFEVITPKGILYTDKTGSFVIFGGVLVDSKSKTNVTAQRMEEIGTFRFSDLPLKDAIKTVRGNGSRVLATFEDPNCGYCKKLANEISKLDNITIYTFLLPILSQDSKEKSTTIWCATDQSETWNRFMTGNQPLPDRKECVTPLDRNLALSQKLHINGTPAILFANNTRSPGYLAADQIELKLATKSK